MQILLLWMASEKLDALCRECSLQCSESYKESLLSPDNTTSLVWTGVDPMVKHVFCIFSSALQIFVSLDCCFDSVGTTKDNDGVLEAGDRGCDSR